MGTPETEKFKQTTDKLLHHLLERQDLEGVRILNEILDSIGDMTREVAKALVLDQAPKEG